MYSNNHLIVFPRAGTSLFGQGNILPSLFNHVYLLLLIISTEISLFCSLSQRNCVCKCLGLFEFSQATSGRIVAGKTVEEVLVYSTMINQRAGESSQTNHKLKWPKAENRTDKYLYTQLNIIQSDYGYSEWKISILGIFGAFHRKALLLPMFAILQFEGSDVQLSLNAMLSWPLQRAAGE